MRIIKRDQKPLGKYEISKKRDIGLKVVPNNSADRLLICNRKFDSDVDIFRFGDFETTFNVIVFSGSSSVNGKSDGISRVRRSHVRATSNLLSKLNIYLNKKKNLCYHSIRTLT